MHLPMTNRCVAPALLICIAFVPSCRKPAVESYRVPKEPASQTAAVDASGKSGPNAPSSGTASPGGQMANTAVATAAGAALVWTAPPHWQSKAGSAMRKGTYVIKADGVAGEAELSITAFPGDVGGDLANLNRWRSQVNLPPVAQAEFDATTQHLDRNDLHMTVVDIVGTGAESKPVRILGAMIPHSGATWFFKLMGPDAIVAKEKAAFAKFLDSIKAAPATK
jgi:hypothetical protein